MIVITNPNSPITQALIDALNGADYSNVQPIAANTAEYLIQNQLLTDLVFCVETDFAVKKAIWESCCLYGLLYIGFANEQFDAMQALINDTKVKPYFYKLYDSKDMDLHSLATEAVHAMEHRVMTKD